MTVPSKLTVLVRQLAEREVSAFVRQLMEVMDVQSVNEPVTWDDLHVALKRYEGDDSA